MNIDASLGRRGCRSATIVVATALFIGSLPFLLPIACVEIGGLHSRATRHLLLKDIDHVAVRDAGRTFLKEAPSSGRIAVSQLPTLLRDLKPVMAHVDNQGWLLMEFGGGFHHHGLLISAASAEGAVHDNQHTAYTPLADGIWYYEDVS